MRVDQMLKLKVIELSGGSQLGEVSGLLIDPRAHKIVALTVARPGLLAKPRYIPFEKLVGIENDVATVQSEDVLVDARSIGKSAHMESITHRTVITEDGKQLGQVRTYEFDPRTGDIESLTFGVDKAVLGGLWKSAGDSYTIPMSLVKTIGENVVVDKSVPELTGMARAA